MLQKPTILIIFGISGDLSKRYLLPAIQNLKELKMLPKDFEVVGITRQSGTEYFQMDMADIKDYEKLSKHLEKIESKYKKPTQRLFYLSVPPEASGTIIKNIGTSSLVRHKKHTQNKILMEKPFGSDLKSAKKLQTHIHRYFTEKEIYRVDHYLAKPAVQHLTIPLVKKKPIEKIDIIASEKIDIEGRVNFYEQTGALRDVVQNHLLELTALMLMRKSRADALKKLKIVGSVTRGQYIGYRDEVKNKVSLTETFVSITLQSDDPKWKGVPITISAGKAFKDKITQIRVAYKNGKAIVFDLNKKYKKSRGAYEEVLFNAINSNQSMFVSSEEVLQTWRIIAPIQKAWKNSKDDMIIYPKGSTIESVSNMLS